MSEASFLNSECKKCALERSRVKAIVDAATQADVLAAALDQRERECETKTEAMVELEGQLSLSEGLMIEAAGMRQQSEACVLALQVSGQPALHLNVPLAGSGHPTG